jgi:hypothetical protein
MAHKELKFNEDARRVERVCTLADAVKAPWPEGALCRARQEVRPDDHE